MQAELGFCQQNCGNSSLGMIDVSAHIGYNGQSWGKISNVCVEERQTEK